MSPRQDSTSLAVLPALSAARPGGRRNVPAEIVDVLRRSIVSGDLAEGARLPPERELAEHFRVSQPTIREAIRVLEAMGLVDVRHGSGTYVKRDSQHFVRRSLETLLQLEKVAFREISEVRTALGGLSAELAVERVTDEDIAALEVADAALLAAGIDGDSEGITVAATDFIICLSGAAKNPLLSTLELYLQSILLELRLHAFEGRPRAFWTSWVEQFAADRQALIATLRARDKEAALDHLRRYYRHMHEAFESDGELASTRISDADVARALSEVTARLAEQDAAARLQS